MPTFKCIPCAYTVFISFILYVGVAVRCAAQPVVPAAISYPSCITHGAFLFLWGGGDERGNFNAPGPRAVTKGLGRILCQGQSWRDGWVSV